MRSCFVNSFKLVSNMLLRFSFALNCRSWIEIKLFYYYLKARARSQLVFAVSWAVTKEVG